MENENRIAITEDQLRLSNKIQKNIKKAADSWVANNNSGGYIPDESEKYQTIAEKTLKSLECANIPWNKEIKNIVALSLDWGVGLYPTFETDYTNNAGELCHNTQYDASNFFKFINGFWN